VGAGSQFFTNAAEVDRGRNRRQATPLAAEKGSTLVAHRRYRRGGAHGSLWCKAHRVREGQGCYRCRQGGKIETGFGNGHCSCSGWRTRRCAGADEQDSGADEGEKGGVVASLLYKIRDSV